MHEVLAGYVERGEVPALVGLIARHGDVHVDAIGAERDSLFRIASMTKPVTAAAAMIRSRRDARASTTRSIRCCRSWPTARS